MQVFYCACEVDNRATTVVAADSGKANDQRATNAVYELIECFIRTSYRYNYAVWHPGILMRYTYCPTKYETYTGMRMVRAIGCFLVSIQLLGAIALPNFLVCTR